MGWGNPGETIIVKASWSNNQPQYLVGRWFNLESFFFNLSENFKQKTKIYIGVGKEGLVPGINPSLMEVDASLLAEKIKLPKVKV